jgi:hypothetical protein
MVAVKLNSRGWLEQQSLGQMSVSGWKADEGWSLLCAFSPAGEQAAA